MTSDEINEAAARLKIVSTDRDVMTQLNTYNCTYSSSSFERRCKDELLVADAYAALTAEIARLREENDALKVERYGTIKLEATNDEIKAAILAHYGERCEDFDASCELCGMWKRWEPMLGAPPAPADLDDLDELVDEVWLREKYGEPKLKFFIDMDYHEWLIGKLISITLLEGGEIRVYVAQSRVFVNPTRRQLLALVEVLEGAK